MKMKKGPVLGNINTIPFVGIIVIKSKSEFRKYPRNIRATNSSFTPVNFSVTKFTSSFGNVTFTGRLI